MEDSSSETGILSRPTPIIRLIILIGVLCVPSFLLSRVVINEVLYDPVGADTGWEWIELYNAGDQSVNLEGSYIQRGGSTFVTVFTFPYYILRPGRIVLVGESLITDAHFTATLAFQNGDGATDGINYVSTDYLYTDTVLYDAPNVNQLPDDSGEPGTLFAPDVPSGYSLARTADGFDADDSALDFIAEANPTPGLSNRIYCDYAISQPVLEQVFSVWQFRRHIVNHSIIPETQTAQLTFQVNSVIYDVMDIAPLAGGDSVQVIQYLPHDIDQPLNLLIELYLTDDPNWSNNTWSYGYQPPHVLDAVINEFLYQPDIEKQEWIELLLGSSPNTEHSFILRDLAQNQINVTIPDGAPPYVVLCNDPATLLSEYPSCLPHAVITVTGWIQLNNDGDTVFLMNADGVTIDSVAYTGSPAFRGVSLERNETNPQNWHYSLHPEKGTPGRSNSTPEAIPDIDGKLELEKGSFAPKQGEKPRLVYNLPDAVSRINCYIYDLGQKTQGFGG